MSSASELHLPHPFSLLSAARLPLSACAAVLLSAACTNAVGIDGATGLIAESSDEESVIVGSVNWQDVTALADSSEERVNSRSVGYLSIPARGTRCTGFLVAADIVMTNQHCIPQSGSAQGVTFSLRREAGVPSSQQASFSCSEFIGNNASLDYALLRCTGRPGDTFGVVELEARNTRNRDALYVIHQNCDYFSSPGCDPTKKISRGQVVRVNSEIGHNADTLGGSSGSPVFAADTHAVFGLHHVGIGGNSNGRGSYNKAVAMRDILANIASHFPSVELGASAPPPSSGADSNEPNDSASTSTLAGLTSEATDLTITAGDADVFRIDAPTPGTLDVRVIFPHAAGDIDVNVYAGDLSTTPLAKAESASDDEALTVDVEAGTLYVVVFGYQNATNGYDVSFDFAGVPGSVPAAPSGAEPNEGLSTASPVFAPLSLSGVEISDADDEDFYVIDHVGGAFAASIDFVHSAGDLDLVLYNAEGQRVQQSNGVTDAETIASTLDAGRYFIVVVGYSDATGAYELNLGA